MFNTTTIFLSLYLSYRGIKYIINIYKTLAFIEKGTISLKSDQRETKGPRLIILLPLLREQSIIQELADYFAKLNYSLDKLCIIFITTEKEIYEKSKNTKRLGKLALDLMPGKINTQRILERYLGLLPRTQLQRLIKRADSGLTIRQKELKLLYKEEKTTIDLAKNIVKTKNMQLDEQVFFHAHYPKKKGVMADQLNYVVKNLKSITKKNFNEKESYIGVYNADSKPNPQTFLSLKKEAEDYRGKHSFYPEVFQQISAYTLNYQRYDKNFIGWLLKASAIVQTRWALGFEIPMLMRQSSFWIKNYGKKLKFLEKFREPSAYCVGHGMYVRLDTLRKVGWYPNETMNEDLPLGYYLLLQGKPINPLPVLENVENPDSLSMLIAQKASWFWGMIDYFDYLFYASKKIKNCDKFRATLMALRGLKRDALSWLFCSFGVFLLLISLFLFSGWWRLIPLFALLLYVILPSFLLVILLPRISKLSSDQFIKTNLLEAVFVSLFSTIYLLISCVGPWKTLLNKFTVSFFKATPIKTKTER